MPQEIESLSYCSYFDNLFTSVGVLQHPNGKGYEAIDTTRKNRLPQNCSLRSIKDIKKIKRGTYDYALTVDKNVVATRWKDYFVVTVGSTVHGVISISNATRYSSTKKKFVSLGQTLLESKTSSSDA
ncbi:hypothetical protein JTB14_013909 [Gonioctena quinquepunctata]|nr:hypothetical protein JTB14_013909 [Gonioctena quinquepunctata]